MDIKEVVKTAILRNSHEWGDEQAEAVLKAINEAGFLVVPAKAQAVTEGYVLVSKEPTKDTLIEIASVCIGDDFANLDEAKELYNAAIKAQDPAND